MVDTMPRKTEPKPPPVCKAILLCRNVYKEENGCTSIESIFEFLYAPALPFSLPFVVFLRLVDGIGSYTITAEIHDLKKDVILAKTPGMKIKFDDRQTTVEIGIPVVGLVLGHLGSYDVVVFADGSEIDRHQFTLKKM
jgi:hypothetical protein